MKDFKRRLAIVLAACMVLTNVMPAFAEETAEIPAVGNEIVQEEITETELDVATSEEALHEDAEIENDDIEKITPSDGDIEEVLPSEAYAFIREAVVDGVRITITADAGVFPENAELYAVKIEDDETKEAIDEAVEKEKGEEDADKNVASDLKFDIKMLADGEEIQPDTSKGSVKVTFALEEVVNDCLDINVYHVKEDAEENLVAETLDVDVEKAESGTEEEIAEADTEDSEIVEGTVITAEINGFSYYVVEFTYNSLTYELPGSGRVQLSEILATLGIEGIVTAAEVSNEELFTVEKDATGNDWTVTALQAFSSEEWLKVTIDGKEYTIIVTDTGEFTTWAEFEQALLAAKDGAILKLTQDLTAVAGDHNLQNPEGKTVTIDLNGFTLNRNCNNPDDYGTHPVINMPTEYKLPSKLIIEDSSVEKTGTITGGKGENYGGGISVNSSVHTLIIHGGNITGNVCSGLDFGWPYGSGIGVGHGQLIMDGGSVTENTIICTEDGVVSGGAVIASKDKGDASIIIGGNTVIKNNVLQYGSTKIPSDLCIYTESELTIGNGDNGCPAPENGMEIGAFLFESPTKKCSGAFTTNGSSDYVKYFFADYPDQYVKFETDHLELAEIPSGSHKINIGSFENGSVTSNKQIATPNEVVTLTVSPDTGYHLKADTLKVTYNDGSTQTITPTKDATDDTKYTFKMPGYPVTVTAEFEEMTIETWGELQNAIDLATPGEAKTIMLTQDLTASPSDTYISITGNKIITLDLNNHTLDRGLKGGTPDKKGNVIRVTSGASLTLKNGTITGSNYEIDGKNDGGKGAVFVSDSDVVLENVVLKECTNVALYLYNSGAKVNGCRFYGNTYGGAMVGGAAIDVGKSETLYKKIEVMIEGCSFENNVITGGSGSAIHLYAKTGDIDMTIKDSTFTGNHAGSVESDDDGGAICAYSDSLVLDGCTITGNTAAAETYNNHCGGVSVSKNVKSFIIKGKTVIKDNTCGGEPADLSLQNEGAIFKVEDLKPESNIGVMTVYDIEEGASAVIGENAKDADLQYFFADNPDYSLKCENGNLILINGKEINIGSFKNGSVTSDKKYATPSDTVTLTVSPDTGYHLKADTLKVTYNDGSTQTITPTKDATDDTKYTFTMPGYPVTVTAEFEETIITTWAGLQAAITAAKTTPTTITLTQNLTAESTDTALKIADGQNITLDLNTCTLDRGLKGKEATAEGNVIKVGEGATLTVMNGTITGANASNSDGALGGDKINLIQLNKVRFEDCKGCALSLSDVKCANIEDCTFTGNTGANGGAIDIKAMSGEGEKAVTIKNSLFENNRAITGSGSAIRIYGDHADFRYSDVNIINSTFTGNVAEKASDASTICAYRLNSLVLDGCTITENTAVTGSNCAGLSIGKWADKLTIKGKTVIKDNTVDGKPADMSLYSEDKDKTKFKVEGLDPESEIGIKLKYDIEEGQSRVIVEEFNADYRKCFFADNPDYSLKCEDGKLILTNGEKINIGSFKNGSVTSDKQFATPSDTVTLTVIPDERYRLKKDTLKVIPDEGAPIIPTKDATDDTKYTFTMPGCPVTVTAKFEMTINKINIGLFKNGSVTSDKQIAVQGNTVTLTVIPDERYRLKKDTLKVIPDEGAPIIPTKDATDDTKYTFTMPGCPVTVTAEFEEMTIKTWAGLQAEITKAGSKPTTITLTQNLTAESTDTALKIADGQDITLDLNGYTLDRGLEGKEATAEGNVIKVGEGATLTVMNGTITGSNPSSAAGALLCQSSTDGSKPGPKELNLTKVKFTDCKGGALSLYDVENANIESCTFIGNTNENSNGGAIDINAKNISDTKKVTVKDCLFENNKVTNGSGSAICIFGRKVDDVPYADVTIIDSEFTGNIAGEDSGDGGAICAYRINGLVLDGCTITGNTSLAKDSCGGLSIGGWADKLTIKGKTIISGNTCLGKPADLCLQKEGAIFKVEDLKPESNIGVMTVYDIEKGASAVIGENAKDADLQYFFADNPDYSLKCEDGKLILTNGAKKPDPKKKESSSGTYSLFTGTWNNPVSNGKWTLDANGIWHYATTASFRNTWGYIENPYAKPGQHKADWFYFDNAGNMLIGWRLIGGKWYYLNPFKDGTGTLGACLIGPGKTPDGYEIDDKGAWTGR